MGISIDSALKEILANSEARAMIEGKYPGLSANPMINIELDISKKYVIFISHAVSRINTISRIIITHYVGMLVYNKITPRNNPGVILIFEVK